MNEINKNKIIVYVSLLIFVVGLSFVFSEEEIVPEPIKIVSPSLIENEEKNIPIVYEKKEISVSPIIVQNTKKNNDQNILKDISLKKEPIQKEQIQNIKISDIDPYNMKIKEETITLSSTSDKNNKYAVFLKSSQKIISVLPGGKYILLNGTIEEDSRQSKFSFSLNEHYKNYIEYTYIEVTNKEFNTTISCDGSFLSGVDPDYKYFLKLDISGDMLSCYIDGEEENNYSKDNKLLRDLNISNKILPTIKEKINYKEK